MEGRFIIEESRKKNGCVKGVLKYLETRARKNNSLLPQALYESMELHLKSSRCPFRHFIHFFFRNGLPQDIGNITAKLQLQSGEMGCQVFGSQGTEEYFTTASKLL